MGFQRELDENRARDIAEYLGSGTGSIPSNVVLSAQPESALKYNTKTKTISFARANSTFLVLDGQHRLWGYSLCRIRHRVPVAIYSGLTRAEEARLFIDINTNQKGVPAALLLDIKRIAAVESQMESTLRDIFDRLADDSKSPLVGQLSKAKSVAGRISRVTFNRALSQALASNVLSAMDEETRYRLILNYLNAFDATLHDKKQLVRSAFFEAIFDVFDEIVRATLQNRGNVKKESLQEAISPITNVNFRTSSGTLTKKAIVNSMQTALRKSVAISKEML